jgi:hypothetical protein
MSWTDRIKKLVQRDKKEQIVEKGKGWTFDDPFSSVSGNLVVDAGYTNLKSALTMDQSLLARFADYENMDDYPELSCCLDIFSDDTTITDNLRGKTIWGESKDTILKDIIDDCLHRRLRIEEDIWLAIRTLCKYGNVYAEIITTDIGVVGLNFLPVPTMRRLVTMKGDLVGFIQDLKGRFNTEGLAINDINKLKEQTKERGMIFFEPWEIVHWRLQSKFTNSLYGYAVFDAARWVWKRLVMLEDTALLYQLTRSPGRYAFYIDTGDLPPDEAMALVKKVKRQYKKRTLVNPSTGELEFRNNPLCLTGDTKIPLLDGRILSLFDIVNEYEKGKKLWVYSCSILKGNKLMPMPISWAGKTRENAKLVKITLDNGEIIRCTPDHKFPTRKGEKISASDLCPGDSLMPFRRYKDKITRIDKLKGELNGYEKVYDPSDKKWKWIHRIVVSVEYLDEREDTYTLTINGTHTFALDAGIFVFNSPEDDMWIPTRSGKESARVDVLSGPDWQSMDSIEYLRDKMFTSIKIPRSYYGGDAEAEQGLAQKDVRFARTCMRIQREFRNGIRQILRVHLAAINIDPDTVEWDTRMTMPSSIFELQQIEVMNAQAGLIETLSQFFPKEWLLRRILHLSQDDAVSVVNDKMSEEERALMDQARIASSIEKRYPGIDIGDATIADAGQEARNEEVKFSREIKKLTEMVSKSMQESNRVIKKLEEMDLSSKRDTRKIDNSIKYIRRVK